MLGHISTLCTKMTTICEEKRSYLSVAIILQEIVILLECSSQTGRSAKELLHRLIREVELVLQELQWPNPLALDQVLCTFALHHLAQVRQLDHFQGRGVIREVQNLPFDTSKRNSSTLVD